jgi:sugar transferase (PEP-CTERM/EpsH1 system associated)
VKILWVKSDFLHPTTKGGHIRTLEMLRRLHREHEIHYVAFADAAQPEGVERSKEYATRAYPVPFRPPSRRSPRFLGRVLAGLVSPMPVSLDAYRSSRMQSLIEDLRRGERFDALVCDFLTPAVNIPAIEDFVVFQHNVETAIWRRHAEHAADPFRRWYFGRQARVMFEYERAICRCARHVIAVSEADAAQFRESFGVASVSAVPTGVDLDYFRRPAAPAAVADLVFVGSMDWMPNIQGVRFFLEHVWPLIRRRRPECTLAIVGRQPPASLEALAGAPSGIRVTGTVDDVRPYLWGSLVSIVPLYIGGGTRLKIYEAMAAGVPVVSTTVGAEGLDVEHPRDIRIADTPQDFAAQCLELLDDTERRAALAQAALELMAGRFSWERAAGRFAEILESVYSGAT